MESLRITLLAEDLGRLSAAAGQGSRFPALERIWARGDDCGVRVASPDHLRFAFFGIDTSGMLPVAALTHLSDSNRRLKKNYYWLRTDPVTMWADMAKVFMTSYGFADLDPYERNEIENCVRGVLREEGIQLHAEHPERWCIALDKPLPFNFTHLDDALGMDVAEALPDHPEARYWRRMLTELQVALHHCPVNVRRRARGLREVNSVWFWGGGFMPEASTDSLADTVYSNHPVSRGLAIIHDCKVQPLDECHDLDPDRDGRAIFIDWTPPGADARQALNDLDRIAAQLLALFERRGGTLALADGGGACRLWSHKARRRFWRRERDLSSSVPVKADP